MEAKRRAASEQLSGKSQCLLTQLERAVVSTRPWEQHTYILNRNFEKESRCTLTRKLSLTQAFRAALSWGCVTKVLGTRENGADFSHALCPASLRKEREKKGIFRKVGAHRRYTTKMSRANTRPFFCITLADQLPLSGRLGFPTSVSFIFPVGPTDSKHYEKITCSYLVADNIPPNTH